MKYTAEFLAAVSRYQNCFEALTKEIHKGYLCENAGTSGGRKRVLRQGKFRHMAQILTSIALL